MVAWPPEKRAIGPVLLVELDESVDARLHRSTTAENQPQDPVAADYESFDRGAAVDQFAFTS